MSTAQTPDRDGPVLPAGFVGQVVTAPDTRPGRPRTLDHVVTLVGSRRDCDVPIDHTEVSKVHCALIQTGHGLAIADLSSRSGTFVNGERITAAVLRPGDSVRCGPVDLKIDWGTDRTGQARLAFTPPLHVDVEGHDVQLNQLPAVIGRRSNSQIQVDTPDVSLAHAIIFAYQDRPAIFDLGSRSGTIVNGQRVQSCWLRDNDTLTIGGEGLHLSWAGAHDDFDAEVAAPVAADPTADTVLRGIAAAAQQAEGSDLHGVMSAIASNLDVLHKSVGTRVTEVTAREQHVAAESRRIAEETERNARDRAEMKRRTGELDERMAEVIVREKAVQKNERSVEKRTEALERARAKLRTATTRLRRERDQIEADQAQLDKALADLRTREATVERQVRQVAEAQAACEALRLRLSALEDELKQREAGVLAKERETRAVEDRMEAFQRALAEASEVFTPPDAASSARPDTPPPPPPPRPRERAADKPKPGTGILPGPVVDQPIFAGGDTDDDRAASTDTKRKRRWWS